MRLGYPEVEGANVGTGVFQTAHSIDTIFLKQPRLDFLGTAYSRRGDVHGSYSCS
jgi:hypothetical protein